MKKSGLKILLLPLLLLISALLFFWKQSGINFSTNLSNFNSDINLGRADSNSVNPDSDPTPENLLSQKKEDETFFKKIKFLASQVSQTQSDPEKLDRDLSRFSSELTKNQLQQLSHIVIDQSQDGDERSLAAYLLSLNTSEENLDILKNVLGSQIPDKLNERVVSFEETLRAQAIDGLIDHPQKQKAIQGLIQFTSENSSSFLNDRAQRALVFLKGQGPDPRIQEDQALTRLLERFSKER